MKKTLALFLAITLMLAALPNVHATVVYYQGFEDPNWVPGMPGDWQNFDADIERVVSGTDGINSSVGNAHARIYNTDIAAAPSWAAPFTQLGGYSSVFGSGFRTTLDIYLDPAWSTGLGFDYSAAVNDQTGTNLRDFIFNVGVINGELLINASNLSFFDLNEGLILDSNMGDYYTVASEGWYTFEHVFYDQGGVLAVDYNLFNSSGVKVYTITRSTATDLIATVVGGNRYAWLTYDTVEGLAIDASGLDVPEGGATVMMLGVGLGAIGVLRRFKRAG